MSEADPSEFLTTSSRNCSLLRPGVVELHLELKSNDIADVLSSLGQTVIETGVDTTIFTRYIQATPRASESARRDFLQRYLWFTLSDFLGSSPRRPATSKIEHALRAELYFSEKASGNFVSERKGLLSEDRLQDAWSTLEYPDSIEDDDLYCILCSLELPLKTLESWCSQLEAGASWKSWKQILNKLDLATHGL
jgi:hypothetical protein